MLLRSVCFAAAVGFAVSAGQYLPTLFAGAGRFSTLTTEAVTLASGSDRRVVGAYAFLQSALPLAVYGLAIALPLWMYRDRRALRHPG
jgi:putative thiamine transport system permease protein